MERRRKAVLPAVIGTPEHLRLIRRDLVVCPPFWLLPRIETGDSFEKGPARAPLLRPARQEICLQWHLREKCGGLGDFLSASP